MPQESTEVFPVPHPSEPLGTVPQGSEPFRPVQNASEQDGAIRNDSERFGTVPQSAERTENHTLTTREVARRFEAAGVARTERSIVKWCQPHGNAPARLDSFFDPNERRYFITRESVERAIQEEQAKAMRPAASSESFRTVPHTADAGEIDSEPRGAVLPNTDASERIEELERRLLDLTAASQMKHGIIQQLKEERKEFLSQLSYQDRLIGQLENKLLQLEGPKIREERIRLRVDSIRESDRGVVDEKEESQQAF